MTYEEYKNAIDFLCIEYIQVTVDLKTEYDNFKNLNLITNAEEAFEWLDEFSDDINHDIIDTHVMFWLDPMVFELKNVYVLEERENLENRVVMHDEINTPMRQISLDYSSFVKLTSLVSSSKK